MNESKVHINKAAVEHLKKKIVLLENQYLKKGKRNDQSIVDQIKKLIEDEIKCKSKR